MGCEISDDAPILDYASPRKRVRFRLPANSTLECRVERDEVVVREYLRGQDNAVIALLGGCLTLAFLISQLLRKDGFGPMPIGLEAVPVSIAVLEAIVMLLVIHQTWRQTLLVVRYNEMLLSFTSPLYRKHYRWTGSDIADILLIETANSNTGAPLAELLITRSNAGEIRLFTDHHAADVLEIVNALPAMLREGVCGKGDG